MNFTECCDAVIEAAEKAERHSRMHYAAAYANEGKRLYDAHAMGVQALYILNNIQYWRGGKSKEVRAALKMFAEDA